MNFLLCHEIFWGLKVCRGRKKFGRHCPSVYSKVYRATGLRKRQQDKSIQNLHIRRNAQKNKNRVNEKPHSVPSKFLFLLKLLMSLKVKLYLVNEQAGVERSTEM